MREGAAGPAAAVDQVAGLRRAVWGPHLAPTATKSIGGGAHLTQISEATFKEVSCARVTTVHLFVFLKYPNVCTRRFGLFQKISAAFAPFLVQ